MLTATNKVNAVTHPLVASIYLKKDFSEHDVAHDHDDVLVIETNFKKDSTGKKDFDSYMTDLLSDLHDLQIQAEQKVGRFDRIDIRYM